MLSKPNTTHVYEALVWANATATGGNANGALELTVALNSSSSSVVNVSAEQREAALRYGPCGEPDPLAWHLVRPAGDPEFPWPGTIFGAALTAIWYWCSDQVFTLQTLYLYST